MHPRLKQVLNQTIDIFKKDPRVPAAYMGGSVGTANEDAFSDVDPVFLVRPDDFASLDQDLPSIFGGIVPAIHLWWPERGNCETWRNYAILFEMDDFLFQYDITIQKVPDQVPVKVRPHEILFDQAGILEAVPDSKEPKFSPERLLWTVQIFWVYAYIHAKYLRRGDIFKLLYAQDELFQAHVEILRALHPDVEKAWWPLTVKRVADKTKKKDLLLYFGHTDRDAIAEALKAQLSNFSRDAKAACEKWNIEYPDPLETEIRKHLDKVFQS